MILGGRTVAGGAPTLLLTGPAVALVAVSLAPWYRRTEDLGVVGPLVLTDSGNAWQASTLWSVAVVLAVLAAALGFAATVAPGGRARRRVLTMTGVGLALLATGAWLRQGWELAHPPAADSYDGHYSSAVTPLPDELTDPYRIVRDHIYSSSSANGLGQTAGQTAAALVGGALVATILVVLVVVAVQARRTALGGT